jgi:peptidoglycan-associated lipoprotein
MVRSLSRSPYLRLAFVAVATVSMAACQKKAPTYPTQQTTQRPAEQGQPPRTELPPTTSQQAGGPVPGSAQDFVVNVGDRVYFDTDQYDIREDARPLLQAQSQWLRRYGAVRVRIEGNCDERGTREYNLALGARRANAVRDFLVSQGVTGERITTISFGKEQPLDTGSGEESWQKNRNARTAIVGGAS